MDNLTYDNCAYLIGKGSYGYRPMLDMLCLFVMLGALTDAESLELRGMMPEPLPAEDAGADTQTPGTDETEVPPAE